jgi:signal transduction histidine kinase
MGSTATPLSQASRTGTNPVASADAAAVRHASLHRRLEVLAGGWIADAAMQLVALIPADIQVGDEELSQHLIWIAGACSDGVPDDTQNGAITTLRRRLVDVIRENILQRWSDDVPDAATMLETLQGLERAQKACAPSADQSFIAELSERGGLDLVVEVAHDMRSPLTSILFLSEILHRGQSGDFNEVQKRQIGIIYSAALGLVGLASDMIEMAKGGSRLRDPAPEAFSVNEILRSVHDLVQPTAEEKKLSVTIHTLESEHRIGFPIPLNRILLNLTTNALKFTHSGGVDVTAEQVHSTRVRFSVRDTGPGIAPEAIETLYQPFRREPSRESGYYFSGTGLGLAICRRLVKALGAEIHIETRPEWGTRFYFELDLPPASAVMM